MWQSREQVSRRRVGPSATSMPPTGRRRRYGRLTACALAATLAFPLTGLGQETAAFFKQNCSSCHTIGGGRLVGPDLKDLSQRKDRAWLVRFVLNPQAMIDRGDPYALQILDEARGVVMQPVAGLTRERVNLLLDLIDAESALEKSQFEGIKFSDRPFTPAGRRSRSTFVHGEGAPEETGGLRAFPATRCVV